MARGERSPLARVMAFRSGFADGAKPGLGACPADPDYARGFVEGRKSRDAALQAFQSEVGHVPKDVSIV